MNTPMQHAPALRPASTAPANTLGFPLTPLEAAPAKASTFGLLDIWRILIKYRWLILASLLVGIAAAIATVMLKDPQYKAAATLEINQETVQMVDVSGTMKSTPMTDAQSLETHYGLLRSTALAERVARDLNLAQNPAVVPNQSAPPQQRLEAATGVDAVIERGYVDPNRLFVTGGSGGGVLTAWIVGKTDRFRAAVVQKPVINWASFVLHADNPATFWRYWFPGPPWEHVEHYWARSPLSLVGNVSTPTMLITGEQDYRTPMSESEQYYAALQIREVPSALVRVPDASHGIANKPSNLVEKVAYVLGWFRKWDQVARPATE
mgnify:CR=1 FL=1